MKMVLKKNGTLIIRDSAGPIILKQILNLLFKLSNNGDYRTYSKKDNEKIATLSRKGELDGCIRL